MILISRPHAHGFSVLCLLRGAGAQAMACAAPKHPEADGLMVTSSFAPTPTPTPTSTPPLRITHPRGAGHAANMYPNVAGPETPIYLGWARLKWCDIGCLQRRSPAQLGRTSLPRPPAAERKPLFFAPARRFWQRSCGVGLINLISPRKRERSRNETRFAHAFWSIRDPSHPMVCAWATRPSCTRRAPTAAT